jgi:hypothetical protein
VTGWQLRVFEIFWNQGGGCRSQLATSVRKEVKADQLSIKRTINTFSVRYTELFGSQLNERKKVKTFLVNWQNVLRLTDFWATLFIEYHCAVSNILALCSEGPGLLSARSSIILPAVFRGFLQSIYLGIISWQYHYRFLSYALNNQVDAAVTLYTCIQAVPGTNLGRDTGYCDVVLWFSTVSAAECWRRCFKITCDRLLSDRYLFTIIARHPVSFDVM